MIGLCSIRLWLLLPMAFLLLAQTASAVNIDWVTVGGAGNSCDVQAEGCFGAVSNVYQIGKYEVTNGQYVEFLNAVAATDTNALYNTGMASDAFPFYGGITRSGNSGSYTYSAIVGSANEPVNLVSFYDGLRFANWLQNGQPAGAQGNATTEDGAYTITLAGITDNSIVRNAGATIVLTSEDEWYKAAYYDAVSMSYFDYPAGSDTLTTCAAPGATPNTANCLGSGVGPTDVGSYAGSASPNGTFDQGGNLEEWNEAIISGSGRGVRGGNFTHPVGLSALGGGDLDPLGEFGNVGFRVARTIPEPSTALLIGLGLVGLGARRRALG